METRYRIWQRKPDVTENESAYSTSISISTEAYPVVGYGFSQEQADDNVIKALLKLLTPSKE